MTFIYIKITLTILSHNCHINEPNILASIKGNAINTPIDSEEREVSILHKNQSSYDAQNGFHKNHYHSRSNAILK
ncbi:MAG TPA: hypothetical protein VIP70_01200 [Nitrososphaeraceae archaeon]